MGEGRKGVRHIADCAVYGEEQNGEWKLSVDIDGLILEKTPTLYPPLFSIPPLVLIDKTSRTKSDCRFTRVLE